MGEPQELGKPTEMLAVGGAVEAAREIVSRRSIKIEIVPICRMSAIHEALVKAHTMLKVCDWPDEVDMDGVAVLMREIEFALAVPARNCDRYATPDAAKLAFDDYCHDRRENPVEVCRRKSCRDCQREWLYAAAKEQGAVDA